MKRMKWILCLMLFSFTMASYAQNKQSSEMRKLFKAVEKGRKAKKTQKEALAAEKAAEAVYKAHPEETGMAHYCLGELYAHAESPEVQDYPKAMDMLRQSLTELTENDLLPSGKKYLGYANYNIGLLYACGNGMPQNYDSAYVYFKRAQEYEKALITGYGKLLEFGLGTQKDLPAALMAYAEGINAGADLYLTYYALKYAMELQQKGELNPAVFEKYQQGVANHEFGDGNQGYKLIKEAVDSCYAPAYAEWGTGLYEGTYVEANKELACHYLKKAGDAGFYPGYHNYATYYFMWKVYGSIGGMLLGKQIQKELIPYYEKAAEMGFAPSEYAMGNTYLNALGVKADPRKAYTWLAKSAHHGFAEAKVLKNQVSLGNNYKEEIDREVNQTPDIIAQTKEFIAKYKQ